MLTKIRPFDTIGFNFKTRHRLLRDFVRETLTFKNPYWIDSINFFYEILLFQPCLTSSVRSAEQHSLGLAKIAFTADFLQKNAVEKN